MQKKPSLFPAGSIRFWEKPAYENCSDMGKIKTVSSVMGIWQHRVGPQTWKMKRDHQDVSPKSGVRVYRYPNRGKGALTRSIIPNQVLCVFPQELCTNVYSSQPKCQCQTKEMIPHKAIMVSQAQWGYFEEHRWKDTYRGMGDLKTARSPKSPPNITDAS